MQYSLRQTNYGLIRRISDLELSWLRLAQSAAPYSHKISAARMAGWPSTLHASSSVHIGPRHFDALRSQAAKGLNCAGPGMNPKYFALWSALRDLVRLSQNSVAVAGLNAAALISRFRDLLAPGYWGALGPSNRNFG